MPFQYDVNTGTFRGMPQMKQNGEESSTNNEYSERQSSAQEQQASLNKKSSLDTKAQNQGVPADTAPSQQQTSFTPHMGYAPIAQELSNKAGVQLDAPNLRQNDFAQYMGYAPVAEKLAKQSDVQLDTPNYLDYTKQREIINQENSQKFADSHQGLSNPSAIYDILQQGKALEEQYRNQAEGNYAPLTMGRVAQQRMDTIPQDMAWARQNPFTKEMGYAWADDKKLGELGWGVDDITSMKARAEFHPQEIEELYRQGAIRAPYREYLAEQERLRQEAEAAAARESAIRAASYGGYSEPSYSEPTYSAPVESPTYTQPSYGNTVGFDQLNSGGMNSYGNTNQLVDNDNSGLYPLKSLLDLQS